MWLAPRPTTRGGQPRYSDLAIEIALTLGLVFGLRLRQVEGLLGSVLPLMGLALAVPDHTTLSRRARTWQSSNKAHALQGRPDGPVHILVDSTGLQVYGAGHGWRRRRDCQEFCAVGHDDEKERIITWLSRKNFWTSSWLDVIHPRFSARTVCWTI